MSVEDKITQLVKVIRNTKDIENIESILSSDKLGSKIIKLLNLTDNLNNKRKMFDDFYEWLDNLTQAEYDDMSLTGKIEKFFFEEVT